MVFFWGGLIGLVVFPGDSTIPVSGNSGPFFTPSDVQDEAELREQLGQETSRLICGVSAVSGKWGLLRGSLMAPQLFGGYSDLGTF